MSELARMLGNVYGDEPDTPAEDAPAEAAVLTRPAAKLPEWADEDVLDEAFAQWVPGPPADAPAVERTMLSELAGATVGPVEPVTEPVPAAPIGSLVDTDDPAETSPLDSLYEPMIDPLLAEATARSAVEAAITRGRQRGDDDILPGKASKKRRAA